MAVKSFVERAFNTLTRRRPVLDSIDYNEQELHTVVRSERRPSAECQAEDDSLSPILSPVEPIDTIAADDILFRKNNVYLKQPQRKRTSSSHASRELSLSTSSGDSGETQSDKESQSKVNPSDNQDLIPGFLFITTRGSDFGTTLILNWAPNSSILPPGLHPESSRTNRSSSIGSSNSVTSTRGGDEGCSSVSVDLGLMEVIRIFYRINDRGIILSGEMVITSKDRNFKVLT